MYTGELAKQVRVQLQEDYLKNQDPPPSGLKSSVITKTLLVTL